MDLSTPNRSSSDISSSDISRGDVSSSDVSSSDIGQHEGPWTETEHLALATLAFADGRGRVELVDGALLIGPGPGTGTGMGPGRAQVVERMRATIAAALPDGLRVARRVALRLGPGCVLLPDLVVTRAPVTADPDPDHDAVPEVLDAGDALLVVEVIGREHGASYRQFKPQLYARSRIPYSVLVDHDAPFGVADMLINGRYHEYARSTDGAVLVVEQPFPLRIPLTVPSATAS